MEYGFASENHRLFPPMIVASITNACNLRCIHCHYQVYASRPDYHRNMMPWDIWVKMCDEMGDHPWSILNLGTDGEPLLHPQFVEMMRYARSKRIQTINLTTNGILLNGDLVKALIEEHLVDIINVSLDAFSDEKYRLIRGGSRNRVYGNTESLIELRNRRGSPVKIQVNIIDQPEVRGELEDFRLYWKDKADNVLVRTYYDATHVTGTTGPDITGKQGEFPIMERWPCQQFWRRFNVADDGVVRFCVDDWYNKTRIGDLRHQTIREIWQGTQYEELRQAHLQSQFAKIPYCAACTEWQGMAWNYDYFVAMEKMLGKALV